MTCFAPEAFQIRASFIVGSLPVSNNVQNAALIITHNLDVDSVGHFAASEVLYHRFWVFGGITQGASSNLAIVQSTPKAKPGRRDLSPQALRSCSTFLICWHTNELRLQDRD
jgi:hypothetical protein